jgi:LPS-assembly protein
MLPAAPPQQDDLAQTPRATVLPPEAQAQKAVIESDLPQTRHGNVYAASGGVVLTYGVHVLRADELTYDSDTNDAVATGHVRLTGGENDEDIHASHGTYNLKTQAAKFYDVSGSIYIAIGPSANTPRVRPRRQLRTPRGLPPAAAVCRATRTATHSSSRARSW